MNILSGLLADSGFLWEIFSTWVIFSYRTKLIVWEQFNITAGCTPMSLRSPLFAMNATFLGDLYSTICKTRWLMLQFCLPYHQRCQSYHGGSQWPDYKFAVSSLLTSCIFSMLLLKPYESASAFHLITIHSVQWLGNESSKNLILFIEYYLFSTVNSIGVIFLSLCLLHFCVS